MADSCCDIKDNHSTADGPFRRILWIALTINSVMFVVEVVAGIISGSASLQADALDFLGDAANYAVSLYAMSQSAKFRSGTALAKGITMCCYGIFIISTTIYKAIYAEIPAAEVMGAIGFLALIANVTCAFLLFKFRKGDSNRESVWVCSRNDAIGNISVIVAAGLVAITGTKWPDLVVALGLGLLAISGGYRVIRKARSELKRENL